jgi:hypothetical protein
MKKMIGKRHKWKWAALGGALGSGTVVLPLFQSAIPPVPFAILTVVAFALAGVSHFVGGDGN